METRLLSTDSPAALDAAVAEAVAELRAGEPVALPTETVYGLAADALRPEAVVKIFEAKERPFFDPLICHLPDREWLERITAIPDESRALVEALIARFWPGPLTLVLPRREIVPDIVTAGLPTVAVRMSAHPVFRAVCAAFGSPLAAPSANRFGRISPTAAEHVRTELDGRIPLILDGGPTEHGLESTIVKVESDALTILRAGPVTDEELCSHGTAGRLGVRSAEGGGRSAAMPEAPGQLKSHYAPRTPLRLFEIGTHFRAFAGGAKRIGCLAFSGVSRRGEFAAEEVLSPTGDFREAAATLFAKLRRLDEAGLDLILAEPVPEHGLGIAIMDRLRKAAAGHT
jgi:L-threonylcarbamoyladenylate synthase